MISKLINLANYLDGEGLVKEANYLDGIIKKIRTSDDDEDADINTYANIVSSYVEAHPNKYEFDIKNASLPIKK